MKIRLISGSVYVALLIGFYLLKVLVHDLCFDLLIYAFALLGTFEMLRAMKEKTTKAERGITFVFAIVCIPACAILEFYYQIGLQAVAVSFFLLTVALLSLFVLRHEETTPENIGVSLLSAAYPTLLLCVLVLANHAPALPALESVAFNSDLLILFILVIAPFADSFAYLFGKFLRGKFPKKMAPNISPNKTVIGGIGGLVGGLVGALVLYCVYNAIFGSFENAGLWICVYLGIGLLSAVATAFGDLVESCLKRKVGVKDMGNIMPGHGGVLDRIDGTMFASIIVYLAYVLVCLFAV